MFDNLKKIAVLVAACGFFATGEALAADLTDVLDAADEVYLGTEKVKDPFDIALTPKFVQRIEHAKLKREFTNGDGKTHLGNELVYERTINEFDIGLEIGLYHDFSFRMNIPIIISDQSSYEFDTTASDPKNQISENGIDLGEKDINGNAILNGKSTLAPATTDDNRPYQFFSLTSGQTLKGAERAGLGDISFGLAWSPYNTERHFIPERPWEDNTGRSTVTLAFDYVAPTGKVLGIDNKNVGSGAHELIFSVAASHRYAFVDPYIRLQYGLPIGLEEYYPTYNDNQKRNDPGMWGRIDLGIEFVPYESIDVKFQRAVKIDLRGYFKYTAEGRQYSELSDALGTSSCINASASYLSQHPECAWVSSKWANAGADNLSAVAAGNYNGDYSEDGLFDYEGYATFGGSLNIMIQPIQYVQIIAGVAADYTQNHFITTTNTGVDRISSDLNGTKTGPEKDGYVDPLLIEERNPTYSSGLDKSGQRIKKVENWNLEWFIGVRLMY